MSFFRKKPVIVEAITFDELVQYGIANGGNTVNGMPWSFQYKEHGISHENDDCYLIPTPEGTMKMTRDDLLITGVKGEIYPCKRDIFEATYESAEPKPIKDALNFGGAIQALKEGKKVARKGWNGKGMWLVLMPALYLPPFNSQEPGARVNDRTAKHIGKDTPLECQPYIVMWTAAQQWQPGWLASQADMLAEDWVVV